MAFLRLLTAARLGTLLFGCYPCARPSWRPSLNPTRFANRTLRPRFPAATWIFFSTGGVMAAEWFVHQNGRQAGPYSGAQLQQMADAGKLAPDDLVAKDGGKQWTPARQLKGLSFAGTQAAVQPNLPPLPSQLPSLRSTVTPAPAVPAVPGSRMSPFRIIAIVAGVIGGVGLLFCLGVVSLFFMAEGRQERERLRREQIRANADKEGQARFDQEEKEHEAKIEQEIKRMGGTYIPASVLRNSPFRDEDPEQLVREIKELDGTYYANLEKFSMALGERRTDLAKGFHQLVILAVNRQLARLLQLMENKRITAKERFGYRGIYLEYLSRRKEQLDAGRANGFE